MAELRAKSDRAVAKLDELKKAGEIRGMKYGWRDGIKSVVRWLKHIPYRTTSIPASKTSKYKAPKVYQGFILDRPLFWEEWPFRLIDYLSAVSILTNILVTSSAARVVNPNRVLSTVLLTVEEIVQANGPRTRSSVHLHISDKTICINTLFEMAVR